MEKRFDVRVPLINTTLLEQLATESEKTGIGESRLLVWYATKYVEMSQGTLALPLPAQIGSLRHSEREPAQEPVQASLGSAALDTLFGDPD